MCALIYAVSLVFPLEQFVSSDGRGARGQWGEDSAAVIMKKMSRAELEVHRQRQQVTFEERLRKEKLKATLQEAEVQGDQTDRAEAAAESAAEESRRQEAKAYDFRLSAERQQVLMDMRSRRLEAEEVGQRRHHQT